MITVDFTSTDVQRITLEREDNRFRVQVTPSGSVQTKGYERVIAVNLAEALDKLIPDTVFVLGDNTIVVIPNGKYYNNNHIQNKVKLIANLEGIEYKYAEKEETESNTLQGV